MIHSVTMRSLNLFRKPKQLVGIMSKATSCIVVGVVAFIMGGPSFVAAVGYKDQSAFAAQSTPATAAKQPILANITRGKSELHAVSMSLGLAQSAIKDGRSATVFLNVQAPIFAAKDLDDDLKYEGFPPIKKMLADFVASRGPRPGLRTLCTCGQASTGGHD